MMAIRKVQHPQQSQLVRARGALPSHRRIEAAPTELRFALLIAAAVEGISLDDRDYAAQHVERMGEALGAQKREIVGRAMVLGVFAVGCAHQATDRQIEAGRAILSLVITIGDK